MSNDKPHSADYFGAQRDFWWNDDFLDLMAERWGLADVRRVLDVGCGAGHWARQILPRCHPDATLLGIDREPAWISLARSLGTSFPGGQRATFECGDATALGAHGSDFDLVTCQTVLIHLADPARAVVEMAARLRPDGLLAVAEPNNLVGALVGDSLDVEASMEARLARLRFQWICETGKRNLGLGDNSLGDRVPELFARAGLVDIQVYNSDKVALVVPPYTSTHQAALREEAFEHETRDFAGWDRATAEQYFFAGGGAANAFEEAWRGERLRVAQVATALREERYYANATGVFYLISGRVPRR
jgi:ubiquinone/menaquinone biosynthesis C-methylase UbiE